MVHNYFNLFDVSTNPAALGLNFLLSVPCFLIYKSYIEGIYIFYASICSIIWIWLVSSALMKCWIMILDSYFD